MNNLYTTLKIFHYKSKIETLARSSGAITAPIHIRIKPTNRCNHRCWYCAYKAEGLQLGKDMSSGDVISQVKMREIISDMSEMGVSAVTFSGGGEPFCYPYLAEALKLLVESGIKIACLTNGALLAGEAASIFSRHGTWVRVSIDGWDDNSYMKYRSVGPGEFTKIIGNMRAFKAIGGGCLLGVSVVIDKDNYGHIHGLTRLLKNIDVDSVKVSPCIVANTSEANNAYHDAFFDAARREITRAREDFADAGFEFYDCYHRQEISFKKDYNWCPFLQILPIIGADLNVYSCQDKAYNLDCGLIGSIKDVRFRDFWFNDKNKFFKIDPSRDCAHHCVADRKNRLVHEYLNADKDHLGFV
jgi:MoaA/NifB/PqqE/SkfB family radical SAM enzyme